MAPLMRSPEGEEREIVPAGVDALSRLGWERVEPKKSAARKAPAKKQPREK